jgi:hypothetical protein
MGSGKIMGFPVFTGFALIRVNVDGQGHHEYRLDK